MAERNVTRGHGLFERRLAKERSIMANRLIPAFLRPGRLLDIGCGTYPYFLMHTDFKEKFGLDSAVGKIEDDDSITLIAHDLHTEAELPFQDNFFDVVTMLAVFEHIESERLVPVLSEIRRILKPGGLYLLTTPAKWTDRLLNIMVRIRLVSPAEIGDHKNAYNHSEITSHLRRANFQESHIRCGYFELFMNLWATAKKEESVL